MVAETGGSRTDTFEEDGAGTAKGAQRQPGLVVIFSGDRPVCRPFPLSGGDATDGSAGAVGLGRDVLAAAGLPDRLVSRNHVRVERDGDGYIVRDLGSRNGTFVDGRAAQLVRHPAPLLRIGRTLAIAVDDCRPFAEPGVVERSGSVNQSRGKRAVGGGESPLNRPRAMVLGPSLAEVYKRIAVVARSRKNLLVLGESGTGKELAAQAYHEGSAPAGAGSPFVAVNCATIPRELAERILFGARRGAYTGAADATGLVQAAAGGTLFLDEIAELDLGVQGKLLRVIESRMVTPLGSVESIPVDVRVCAATHKNLRTEVAARRFREDLYFRVGRPGIRLPPLRERREEIPWLIARAIAADAQTHLLPSVEFVEACVLRAWPGNVRELAAETGNAVLAAMTCRRTVVEAADLDEEAGRSIGPASDAAPSLSPSKDEAGGGEADCTRDQAAGTGARTRLTREAIEAVLRDEGGVVTRTAERLGITRGRLRRQVERLGIDVSKFAGD